MKTKITISLSLLFTTLLTLVALSGCNRNDYGYPPTYGYAYCVEQNPNVGDTITIKAQVLKQGNGIYKAKYTWRINNTSYSKTVIDPLKNDPVFTYVVTTAGSYTVSMSALFNMSKATKSGVIYESASAKAGTFVVSN